MREQHLADPGRVQRQPGPDLAHHRHRGVPGQPVDVEHLVAVADREVHGGQRGAVEVVQERRGELPQPGLHRREQPEVPEPPADDVPAVGGRASAPHSTSSPTSRCAVGSGSPARSASSVSVSRRCCSSKAPSRASARLVTLAPGAEVSAGHPATLPLSGSHALGPPRRLPSDRDRDPTPLDDPGRGQRRDRRDRQGVRRGRRARRPQPRLDYPPYRSSLLRHPTKDLHHADPEGVELWAPAFGHQDVDAARGRPHDPARRRADRRADGRDRPGARRRRPAGAPPARRDLAGQRRRPLHPQARPAPGADRPATSPAPAAA